MLTRVYITLASFKLNSQLLLTIVIRAEKDPK